MAPTKRKTARKTTSSAMTSAAAARPESAKQQEQAKKFKIADDADRVLAKCRQLRDSMRVGGDGRGESDDDDGDVKPSATTTASSSLSSDAEDDSDFDFDDDVAENAFNKKKKKKKKKSRHGANQDEAAATNPSAVVSMGNSRNRRVEDLSHASSDERLQGVMEVSEMEPRRVIVGIEQIAVNVANSILQRKGFAFEIPSRAASNQIYVPELDRIVLGNKMGTRAFLNSKEVRKTAITARVMQLLHQILISNIHITKRDLFYTDVKLFVDQGDSDGVLDDVATMIGCTRSNLHVVASDKGLVVGRINFVEDGDFIDCTKMGVGGKAIPPYIDKIEDIRSDAEFVLLVEKEAAYMRLADLCLVNSTTPQMYSPYDENAFRRTVFIIATRMFLSRLKAELQIPVLGLVDSDPYGLKILSVYMSGSKNMSYDSASLTTPDIKWLGLRPSDLNRYKLPDQCRLDMTENDIKTGKEMLKEDFIQKNPKWLKELEIMVKTKKKAEIQALSSFGFQYITEEYLPRKLREGDWL